MNISGAIKDRIGKAMRINLGTHGRRVAARAALHDLLQGPGWKWGYSKLRKVKGPIKSPTRGGGSHQVEPIEGALIAALLEDDPKALETAMIQGWDLLHRPSEQDNGHRNLWWSAMSTVPCFEGAKFRQACRAAASVYHYAANSDFFFGRSLGGIRPRS